MKAIPFLFIALALSACGTVAKPELRKSQPVSLDYSIGAYGADEYHITLNSDHLTYTYTPDRNSMCSWDGDHLLPPYAPYGARTGTWTQNIRPTVAKWRAFWNEMEAVDIWQWHPEYGPPLIDGYIWSLVLSRGSRNVASLGYSGTPSDADLQKSAKDHALSKRYIRLDDAMMKLIGRKPRWE